MEAHNVCSSAIVGQVLVGAYNYENWKACVQNYLWVRDLWDVVEQASQPPQRENEAEFKAWSKRNVAALHAIQISCDPLMLSYIRNMATAKDAWNTLAQMEASNVYSSAIVGQVLVGVYNYENWKACVQNYLWVRDLWDVVEQTSQPPQPENEAEFKAWSKRNVAALHAIQISCDPLMLSYIRNMATAKDAWNTLAQVCQLPTPQQAPQAPQDARQMPDRTRTLELLKAIRERDLESTKSLLTSHTHLANAALGGTGFTAFHFTIFEGQLDMIDEFLNTMSEDDVKMQDPFGRTILHHAAMCTENAKIAQCLIRKNGELLTFPDDRGDIPLNSACGVGHKDMSRYLYSITTPGFLLSLEDERQPASFFIVEIIKRNLDLLMISDVDNRSIFDIATAHRQEKVFSLIYGLDTRETPYEAFDRTHAELVKEGEKWMKDIAQTSTVVGTLITIMFAALFTVPGGPDQNTGDTGVPLLLRKKLFKIFIISDAISLFASTTSVLIFVGILTSRYTTHDFLKSLPNKLIIGLSSLFISIAAMMVAFSSTVIIMVKGQSEIAIPIVLLAGIPIGLFVWLEFPLLVKIFISTYGLGIFDRKMKWL
ncbi:uncharacterized protein LOC110422833 [Herrania umbratica]|uniref:Uncharacterized protein LOC110422833 n=1 Tax=Herrania umbratica TaxID=108875 RepID=A0A6J1AZB9_9ROSI|nr:uncharacterized protein LOC110422833 [Herrania umbratica]